MKWLNIQVALFALWISLLAMPPVSVLAQVRIPFGEEDRSMWLSRAGQLDRQAAELAKQRKYSEAIQLVEEARSILKSLLGDRHIEIARALINIGGFYIDQGLYNEAESRYLEAQSIYKSSYGNRSPEMADILSRMGVVYIRQGRYNEAESVSTQALEIRHLLLGDRNPDVAKNLNDLALIYQYQGNYEKAEIFYIQSLEIRKSLFGNSHLDIARSLNGLAVTYSLQGRYEKAEPLSVQSLEMRKFLLGSSHPAIVISLNDLALIYQYQGRYKKAELIIIEALEMNKALLGDRHPSMLPILNNLAVVYQKQEAYDKAEPILVKSLEITKSLLGERHPSVAISLNNLAVLYEYQKKYKKAISLYIEAIEVYKTISGDRHPEIANSLNNLAVLYQHQGNYQKTEPLLLQALQLRQALLGNRHPGIAYNLNRLSDFYASQERYEEAVTYQQQGLEIEEANLNTNILPGSEIQKSDYLETLKRSTDTTISLNLQYLSNNSNATNLAFTTILRRKGRILGTLASSFYQVRQNLTPPDQTQLDQLSVTQSQLSNLYHKGVESSSPEQYRTRIIELEQKATQLSENLSRRSTEFQAVIQPVTLEMVQQQIPTDSALIELTQYQPFKLNVKNQEKSGTPHYAAYILTHSGTRKALDLGPIQPIDEALTLHRQNLQDNAIPIPQLKADARKLDALLMQPIRQHLGNTRNLLLSPDSTLNLLPFETLVDENNNYLLETHTITYLTSGRDLQRLTTPKANNNPTLILADPYFGKPGTLATTRTLDLKNQTFPPLDGTRTEATALGKLLNTQPLLGTDATETAIKQTKSPKILHIATHGFFQPSTEATKTNPLLNSGLVLAGFQLGKSGNDDGILTALEVSNLNLTNTKLVTLSACETGLGTTSNGEGIYGLRRALTIAGAESQVISLWKVSDDATKDLMINYYTRLKANEGRSLALHNAQRDMLKSKDYPHPYYWAAFIPSGDWRPLNP